VYTVTSRMDGRLPTTKPIIIIMIINIKRKYSDYVNWDS
jgi:hypothetical protein